MRLKTPGSRVESHKSGLLPKGTEVRNPKIANAAALYFVCNAHGGISTAGVI